MTHLASGDLWAGAENQVHNMTVALHRGGDVEVDVVLLNEGILAERLRAAGVPVTVFDERTTGARALFGAIRRHLVARRTRVLHTHRYKENVLGAAAVLTLRGVRTTSTLHGAPEFTTRAWQLHKSLPQWLDWCAARFIQWPVICVSAELRDRLAESLPRERLRVVPNGVDIERLGQAAAADPGLPAGTRRIRVGFFGRLTPVKRVDLLLEVARRVERERPGTFEFLIFGDGPLRAELEGQASALGLGDSVRFMGFTDQPAPRLSRMDLMLLTSDHEGLPMVVLEAMALGTHVVSHAVGAIPEVLEGGEAGTLVEDQDPEAYALAILAATDQREATAGRTARARDVVRERYSAERTVAEYVAIYRELAKG